MTSVRDILPETALLLELCQIPLSNQSRNNAAELISRRPDWDRFFHLASVWNVEPIVMTNLPSLLPSDLSSVAERAAKIGMSSRAVSLARTLVMNDLLARFDEAHIAAIVLKGAATGATAYGDPSLRTFSDIDLMVRGEQMEAARTLMVSLGYGAEYLPADETNLVQRGHALEFSSANSKVELHASLLSRYLQVHFDNDELWRTSRTIICAGREIRVLRPDLEFLFLCVHGAKHQWLELRWLVDISQLGMRLISSDAASVVQHANVLRVRKILALAVQLGVDLLGTSFGPELTAAMHATDSRRLAGKVTGMMGVTRQQSAGFALLRRLHPTLPSLAFWFSAREHMADGIRSFTELLFGPPVVTSEQ